MGFVYKHGVVKRGNILAANQVTDSGFQQSEVELGAARVTKPVENIKRTHVYCLCLHTECLVTLILLFLLSGTKKKEHYIYSI